MFWKSRGEYTEEELWEAFSRQAQGNNPQRTYILFKEDGSPMSPELVQLRNMLDKQYGCPGLSFANSKELRDIVKNILLTTQVNCSDKEWTSEKNTVMIAADEELYEEKLEFVELIAHLNEVFGGRIRLRCDKWTPQGAEKFREHFEDCHMCLNLYWQKLSNLAAEEMQTAYELLKKDHQLYVFFKEPSPQITNALADFKAGFETNYGHFFCKFKNPDTMNLHFLLQFEAKQNKELRNMLKVGDGNVSLAGEIVAKLDNIPFARNNQNHIQLMHDIDIIQQQIKDLEELEEVDPDNIQVKNLLYNARQTRFEKKTQLKSLEMDLLDVARQIAELTYTESDDRLQKAISLFEQGDNKGAAALLDFFGDIYPEMEMNVKKVDNSKAVLEFHMSALIKNIDETKFKISLLKAERPDDWLNQCITMYEKTIELVKDSLSSENFYDFTGEYACFLQQYCPVEDVSSIYDEMINYYSHLKDNDSTRCKLQIAAALTNLAVDQARSVLHYDTAEDNYFESIRIYNQILDRSLTDDQLIKARVGKARVELDLGNLFVKQRRYKEALKKYNDSTKVFQKLIETHPDIYSLELATVYNNKATALMLLGENFFDDAKRYYLQSLDLYEAWCDDDLDTLSKWSTTLNHYARFLNKLGITNYKEASHNYELALDIRSYLAEECPESYLPKLAETLSMYANLLKDMDDHINSFIMHEQALDIYCQLAANMPDLFETEYAQSLNNFASLLRDMSLFDEAEKNYNHSLQIYKHLASINPSVFDSYVAKVKKNIDNLVLSRLKAILLGIQANYSDISTIKGMAQKGDVQALHQLGFCYYRGKDMPKEWTKALYYLEKAAEIGDTNVKNFLKYNEYYCYRGIDAYSQRRIEQAINLLTKALSISQIPLSDSVIYYYLGISYEARANMDLSKNNKDYDNSFVHLRRALDIFIANTGKNSLDVANCYYHLGSVFQRQGKTSEALDKFKKALTIKETILGSRHEESMEIRKMIEAVS
jgi:tetratricopeptide (TPR) repeat protein